MAALDLAPSTAHPSPGPFADADEPPTATSPFAPLFTAGTDPYALATLDEHGRALAAVYVPESLLL